MTGTDFEAQLDRDLAERHARMIELLKDHPEELADYERDMKNLRLGITGAKNSWHSISEHQRAILRHLAARGGRLEKRAGGTMFSATRNWGGAAPPRIMLSTVRALASRYLLDWDGGAIDPEAAAVLSERGAFIVKHGGTNDRD